MVLDFAKEAINNMGLCFDQYRLKETLAWLNSMLCDKRQEVKTLEESIFYLEKLKEKDNGS